MICFLVCTISSRSNSSNAEKSLFYIRFVKMFAFVWRHRFLRRTHKREREEERNKTDRCNRSIDAVPHVDVFHNLLFCTQYTSSTFFSSSFLLDINGKVYEYSSVTFRVCAACFTLLLTFTRPYSYIQRKFSAKAYFKYMLNKHRRRRWWKNNQPTSLSKHIDSKYHPQYLG